MKWKFCDSCHREFRGDSATVTFDARTSLWCWHCHDAHFDTCQGGKWVGYRDYPDSRFNSFVRFLEHKKKRKRIKALLFKEAKSLYPDRPRGWRRRWVKKQI